MIKIEFVRIPDSSFTFHYEIKGPDELVKSERNTRKGVGLRGQEKIRDDGKYRENDEGRQAETG